MRGVGWGGWGRGGGLLIEVFGGLEEWRLVIDGLID